uniref:Uncharacterized protein n=1 Tax=Steinernema glaseri TaxID=37863 RepID=A0A1I7Y737_9BILA
MIVLVNGMNFGRTHWTDTEIVSRLYLLGMHLCLLQVAFCISRIVLECLRRDRLELEDLESNANPTVNEGLRFLSGEANLTAGDYLGDLDEVPRIDKNKVLSTALTNPTET